MVLDMSGYPNHDPPHKESKGPFNKTEEDDKACVRKDKPHFQALGLKAVDRCPENPGTQDRCQISEKDHGRTNAELGFVPS
jgi:hypothetical protein